MPCTLYDVIVDRFCECATLLISIISYSKFVTYVSDLKIFVKSNLCRCSSIFIWFGVSQGCLKRCRRSGTFNWFALIEARYFVSIQFIKFTSLNGFLQRSLFIHKIIIHLLLMFGSTKDTNLLMLFTSQFLVLSLRIILFPKQISSQKWKDVISKVADNLCETFYDH